MTYTLAEIKAAVAKVEVDGDGKQAAELVDMLAGCGEQRGDMMLEYTRQAFFDFRRKLFKQLGVDVECECGVEGCTGTEATCAFRAAQAQLEFESSLEEGREH